MIPIGRRRILEVSLTIEAPFSFSKTIVGKDGWVWSENATPELGLNNQYRYKISDDEFREMAKTIISNDFWSFGVEYISLAKNIAVYTISVKAEDGSSNLREHMIKCAGNCPLRLTRIINRVRSLRQSGGVSDA